MKVTFPKFKSSNEELNKTYDYRCESFSRHVKHTSDGYVITEFLPDVPWAGKYNTICCATFHHVREGRWMHESDVIEDYLRFWCNEDVTPRDFTDRYSFALADAFMDYVKVSGDYKIAAERLSDIEDIHHAWDFCIKEGLYWQSCNYDGMEFSISGDGYRPTLNSYMYADKLALFSFLRRLGDIKRSDAYLAEANKLKNDINDRLWNEKIGMYGVISDDGALVNVREQIGYIPWMYGIPNEGKDACFRYLFDTDCFLAPFGLRTADASHTEYMKSFDHECLWNGPVWPFATSQTLTAIIKYICTSKSPCVSKEEFMRLLDTYSQSQRDGESNPYVDENLHPDTGIWLAREIMYSANREDKDRGAHYNHSTFIDLIITGVCGIQPSEDDALYINPLGTNLDFFELSDVHYHGCDISISWNKKKGLRVIVDGKREYLYSADDKVKICIQLKDSAD